MAETLVALRHAKKEFEDNNDTLSEHYHDNCRILARTEEMIGEEWDGVTVLEDNRKPALVMPDHVFEATKRGDIKSVLKWINADPTEDRANAKARAELMAMGMPLL